MHQRPSYVQLASLEKLDVVSLPWECMNTKSVARRQDHIAFRMPEGDRLVAISQLSAVLGAR